MIPEQSKTMRILVSLTVLVLAPLIGQAGTEEPTVLKTHRDQVSYVIGVDLARNIKRQGIDCDVDLALKGLKDGLSGEKPLISEREIRQILVQVQNEVRQRSALTRGRPAAEVAKKKGETFMAENKKKEGIVTQPSGLQYKILKEGEGRMPTDTDTVECNYRGTLIDGTEFDSSKPGQPSVFKVAGAIPGWKEALKLMRVGSKWQIFVPPEIAYGTQGVGNQVGPNETIIVDIELVGIK